MTGTERPLVDNTAAASAQRLGVAINASSGRLRAAFRVQALRWHPDRNADPAALDRFHEVREAYRVLADAREKAGPEDMPFITKTLSCGTCSAQEKYLQAVSVTRLRSYLLFSRTTATYEVHCLGCARKRLLTASLLSGAIGSWSLTGLPLAIAVAGFNARALRPGGSVDLRLALQPGCPKPNASAPAKGRDWLFHVANLFAALASPAFVAACLVYRFG